MSTFVRLQVGFLMTLDVAQLLAWWRVLIRFASCYAWLCCVQMELNVMRGLQANSNWLLRLKLVENQDK